MAPLVSVCIPAYNHEKYIAACIGSVLEQSIADLEIIVVDDASSDGTYTAARAVADARVRVERHAQNLGPSSAINTAVGLARGRYIAILGSDDLLLPGKLEAQLSFAEVHPEVLAVFGFAAAIDENGSPVPDDTVPVPAVFRQPNRSRAKWLRRFFFEGNCLCAPTALLRKETIGRVGDHDARLLQLQDLDYWIRIALAGELHVIQHPLVAYRVRRSGNISAWRPDANTRLRWEIGKVLRRFLDLSDRAFFFEVFPECTSMEGHEDLPLPFLLGAMALDAVDPGVRLFGVDTLFDVFGSAEHGKRLAARKIWPAFLYEAVKRADPFGLQGGTSVQETMKALQLGLLRVIRRRTNQAFRRSGAGRVPSS
jgi:glycosyltransferase involved in cell wall biosynthesis